MKIKLKNIRLSALHFCLMFIFLVMVIYAKEHSDSRKTLPPFASALQETDNNTLPAQVNNGLSFILFHSPEAMASERMEFNLSRLAKYDDIGVNFCKIDGCVHPDVCLEYGISGFPSVLVFKDGIEQSRILGLSSFSNLKHIYGRVTK